MDTDFFGPKLKRSKTSFMGTAVRLSRPPAKNKLLAGIDPAAVEAVLRHAITEEYRADSPPIFEAGGIGDSVYLIEKGHVRIFKPMEGGIEETFASLGPGDFFGEMALFGDHRRAASAVAEGDCTVWRLRFSSLKELWEHKLTLTRNLLDGAHQQLRAIDERYVQEVIQRERLGLVGLHRPRPERAARRHPPFRRADRRGPGQPGNHAPHPADRSRSGPADDHGDGPARLQPQRQKP